MTHIVSYQIDSTSCAMTAEVMKPAPGCFKCPVSKVMLLECKELNSFKTKRFDFFWLEILLIVYIRSVQVLQQIESSSTGHLHNVRVLYAVYMIALQLFFMDVLCAQFHKKKHKKQNI